MQCLKYMNILYKSVERLGEPHLYPSVKPHTHTCTIYTLRCFINIVYRWQRNVWRYQRGNQNRHSEKEQKTQRPNFVRSIVFSRAHSNCHLQSNWPPRSILNIVEIGVTHQQLTTIIPDLVQLQNVICHMKLLAQFSAFVHHHHSHQYALWYFGVLKYAYLQIGK